MNHNVSAVSGRQRPRRFVQFEHAALIDALCRWFDHNARELPWRKEPRNAYRALVSEAMLQQTQVARVVDAYKSFVRSFPNVRALAMADEQEVLSMWRGLGYYSRARNLHRAAKMIVSEFNGSMPRRIDQLMSLPGVGRYTAGAIASIVFGATAPIVDGNVQRVLMRWRGRAARHGAGRTIKWSWSMAEELVQCADRPGVFNEAMMELGAMICTPRQPRCGECPVSKWCQAKLKNLQHRIPSAARRATPRMLHHHAVAITYNGKILLQQRDESNSRGMWRSMWQVPTIESDSFLTETEIKRALPMKVEHLRSVGGFKYLTTHRRIHFHVYQARVRAGKGIWRALNEFTDLPMSNAQRRILQTILPAAPNTDGGVMRKLSSRPRQ